jgi:hypothetical protein
MRAERVTELADIRKSIARLQGRLEIVLTWPAAKPRAARLSISHGSHGGRAAVRLVLDKRRHALARQRARALYDASVNLNNQLKRELPKPRQRWKR